MRISDWSSDVCSSDLRNPGEGGVEERALALDQVPAIVVAWRRQLFDRARDEIGDHRVERHAATRDQYAGLAGRAEIGRHAARAHRDRKSVVAGRVCQYV